MLRIGLTGGIGAGKSAVATTFADCGGVVVDADVIAREVVEPGTEGLAALVEAFGNDILSADGALDRPALAAKCDRGAQLADELARKMRDTTYDRAQTEQLMREIASDSEGISLQGERSAEQAAMALDSLYLAYANLAGPNPELKGNIEQMYRLLDNPSAYSAPKFAAQMKKTSAAIK